MHLPSVREVQTENLPRMHRSVSKLRVLKLGGPCGPAQTCCCSLPFIAPPSLPSHLAHRIPLSPACVSLLPWWHGVRPGYLIRVGGRLPSSICQLRLLHLLRQPATLQLSLTLRIEAQFRFSFLAALSRSPRRAFSQTHSILVGLARPPVLCVDSLPRFLPRPLQSRRGSESSPWEGLRPESNEL